MVDSEDTSFQDNGHASATLGERIKYKAQQQKKKGKVVETVKPKEKVTQPMKRVGTVPAYLFDPTVTTEEGRGAFVRGVPFRSEEGSYMMDFKYTLPPNSINNSSGLPVDITEPFNISQYLSASNPVFKDDLILTECQVPALTPNGEFGIFLVMMLPSSSGIRYAPNTELADNYRREICFIERDLKDADERARQNAKWALNKNFYRIPGPDGTALCQYGIRLLWPIYRSKNDRDCKLPHQQMVILERGVEIEVIFEFRESSGPNWYIIGVNQDGVPTCRNVRDPKGPYMQKALEAINSREQSATLRFNKLATSLL